MNDFVTNLVRRGVGLMPRGVQPPMKPMTLGFVGLDGGLKGGQEWGEVWPQVSAPVDADHPTTDSTDLTASLPQPTRSSSPTGMPVQPPVIQTQVMQTPVVQTRSQQAQPQPTEVQFQPTPAVSDQSDPGLAAAVPSLRFPELPSVPSLPTVDAVGSPLSGDRPTPTDLPQTNVSPTQPMDTPTVTVPRHLVSPPVLPPPVSLPQIPSAAANPAETRPPYPTAAMTPVPPMPLPLLINAEARSLVGSAETKPPSQARSIQVQIGTIEIRSAAPTVRPTALPRGFQDYLLLRRYVNQAL